MEARSQPHQEDAGTGQTPLTGGPADDSGSRKVKEEPREEGTRVATGGPEDPQPPTCGPSSQPVQSAADTSATLTGGSVDQTLTSLPLSSEDTIVQHGYPDGSMEQGPQNLAQQGLQEGSIAPPSTDLSPQPGTTSLQDTLVDAATKGPVGTGSQSDAAAGVGLLQPGATFGLPGLNAVIAATGPSTTPQATAGISTPSLTQCPTPSLTPYAQGPQEVPATSTPLSSAPSPEAQPVLGPAPCPKDGGRFSPSQPSANKQLSSRFRGVCWNKKNRRWQAAINSGGKYLYLGSFISEEEAARAFDRAAIRIRGQKAKLNFSYTDYLDAHGNLIDDPNLPLGVGGLKNERGGAHLGPGVSVVPIVPHSPMALPFIRSPFLSFSPLIGTVSAGSGPIFTPQVAGDGGELRLQKVVGHQLGEPIPRQPVFFVNKDGVLGEGQPAASSPAVEGAAARPRGPSGYILPDISRLLSPGSALEYIIPGDMDVFGIVYRCGAGGSGSAIWDGLLLHDLSTYSSEKDARQACAASMKVLLHYKQLLNQLGWTLQPVGHATSLACAPQEVPATCRVEGQEMSQSNRMAEGGPCAATQQVADDKETPPVSSQVSEPAEVPVGGTEVAGEPDQTISVPEEEVTGNDRQTRTESEVSHKRPFPQGSPIAGGDFSNKRHHGDSAVLTLPLQYPGSSQPLAAPLSDVGQQTPTGISGPITNNELENVEKLSSVRLQDALSHLFDVVKGQTFQ